MAKIDIEKKQTSLSMVERVRSIVIRQLDEIHSILPCLEKTKSLLFPGKMLRTKMAARLSMHRPELDTEIVDYYCAATELIHTASLCHDDVIDSSLIRRAAPTLWRQTGQSAAILIGDLLICRAIDLILSSDENIKYLKSFIDKSNETCAAEAKQELMQRGRFINKHACISIARGKTGSFFSFIGYICGGDDLPFSLALEEAGYRIGTAYQLSDDVIDIYGREYLSGKTLGTDTARGKFTLANSNSDADIRVCITQLYQSALGVLNDWPFAREALNEFYIKDLQPELEKQKLDISVKKIFGKDF
jgi:geranylgeranyl pyrophosphate synthase